jgi:hypothetical protein
MHLIGFTFRIAFFDPFTFDPPSFASSRLRF